MSELPQPEADFRVRHALWTISLVYAGIGIAMMLLASPKVPYADSWRFLAGFLEHPFPDSVLFADNGHREILPSLVRMTELHWFGANQWLQILGGMALAFAFVRSLWRGIDGDSATVRAASATIVAIGVFWLGNSRKLAHGSETLHQFLILFCLAQGLRCLLGDHEKRSLHAGLYGLLAVLTFGSGAACFASFFLVLLLRREPLRQYAPLGALAAASAVLLMVGNEGSLATRTFDVGTHVQQLLRLIGAPFVWMLSPALDVAHADRLPLAPVSMLLHPIAEASQNSFGPSRTATWPAAAFGGAALLWLLAQTAAAWRYRAPQPRRLFALGIAWFGVAVTVLVVLARSRFFLKNPDQVIAQRYVPWVMLIWMGLMLTWLQRTARPTRHKVWLTLWLACAFGPSQVWTGRYAFDRQTAAYRTAIAAAVEVVGQDFELVETVKPDLLRAQPLLRDAGKTVWRWPEVRRLGDRIPENARAAAADQLTARPVDNLFARRGYEIAFASDATSDILLVVDPDDLVQGLAVRADTPGQWIGWIRGQPSEAGLRFYSLD